MVLLVKFSDRDLGRLVYWLYVVGVLNVVAFDAVLRVLQIERCLVARLDHFLDCWNTWNIH